MVVTCDLNWPYLNLYIKLDEISYILTKLFDQAVLFTDSKIKKFDFDPRAIVLNCLHSSWLKYHFKRIYQMDE